MIDGVLAADDVFDERVLMNGIGATIEVLQPFVDALPADLEVIRFDVPGIGGSPLPVVPYHMTTLAPLVGQLVRQLGHQRLVRQLSTASPSYVAPGRTVRPHRDHMPCLRR